ncbi:hypothetical protein [Citricoccus sp. CH26A]|uniref:hypothetical protein n=1 Tax=Citricoccus sp. CH26A TaxID=1045009 RepID=UPI000255EE35|nr:hypothetical protein [Citricoccus sp. CH26A]
MVLAFLAVGAVLAWFTVNPRVNSAPRVDALLVLATQPGAHEEAHRLVDAGVTDLLIVSTTPRSEATLCHRPPAGVEVECFSPEPVTTQGEAMVGSNIARQRGVHSLGVLTFNHHIERSRMLVERCWNGPVHMYEFQPARSTRGYAHDFVYAMAAYGKTFLTPGCGTPPPDWLQMPIDRIKN